MKNNECFPVSSIVALMFGLAVATAASAADMSFFITSTGSGKGADYGGLAGADAHCQALATAAGAGGHTWHAYLSTSAAPGQPAVNARDRIGSGPWQNAKGVVIAKNVAELHGDNNVKKETALTEKGDIVNANAVIGILAAQVGHHNRNGTGTVPATYSWNSAHTTPGCSDESLRKTGGAGLLYCFAVN